MKNRLDLVIACTAALACCLPFAANGATKKISVAHSEPDGFRFAKNKSFAHA